VGNEKTLAAPGPRLGGSHGFREFLNRISHKIFSFYWPLGFDLKTGKKMLSGVDYRGRPPELLRKCQSIFLRLFPTSTKTGWVCQRWRIAGNLVSENQTCGALSPEMSGEEVKEMVVGHCGAKAGAGPR